jgi:hypothetical protein
MLTLTVIFSLQMGQAKVTRKRISLEDILQSQRNKERFCIRNVSKSLFTYKSCINVGKQVENTLVDVANFTTFNKLKLHKKKPYTNCRAKQTMKIRFKLNGKSYMLKHRLIESAKIKYGKAKVMKKNLVHKVNERSQTIKEQLHLLPRCSS